MTTVALVTTFPSLGNPLGGVATYAQTLLCALREEPSPSFVVFGQRNPPPDGPSVIAAWEFGWSFDSSVRHSLQDHAVDLVHVQYEPFLFGNGPAALPALRLPRLIRRMGTSCIVTLHAVPFPSLMRGEGRAPARIRAFSFLYLRALRWMAKGVDRFIVHEPEQAESLKGVAGVDEDAIAVIPHGVECSALPEGTSSPHPFTIGTFGFLTPYRDPDLLLRAFSQLRARLPQARLRFSLSRHPRRHAHRDERLYRDILRRAASLDGVETFGHIPESELPVFLSGCDLIVLPYRYAVSASGVASKSIGAGVPVLIPEGSGSIAQADGWSFERTPDGLASALVRQSTRLGEMRNEARALAEERSWQRVAQAHRLLYG